MYLLIRTLVDPFLLLYLLIVVVVGNLWWRRGLDRSRLILLSLLVLALGALSTPVAKYLAIGSLEWRYPPGYDDYPDEPVIVVLGGAVLPPDRVRTAPELGDSTLVRCLTAARVYHRIGSAPVVLSGGPIPEAPEILAADLMCEFMLTQGIAESDLIVETRSTTTFENAQQVARLLRERDYDRPILLVTDATHLRRAQACFAAQGIDTIPIGCRYRATNLPWTIRSFLPQGSAAGAVGEASHEWVGMGWYWMRGAVQSAK